MTNYQKQKSCQVCGSEVITASSRRKNEFDMVYLLIRARWYVDNVGVDVDAETANGLIKDINAMFNRLCRPIKS